MSQRITAQLSAPLLRRRVPAHQFGAGRTRIVRRVARRDGVLDQVPPPLESWIDHRSLHQSSANPFEAPTPVWSAQHRQVRAAPQCRRPGGEQAGIAGYGAVTVLAADLDGGGNLPVNIAIPVYVLRKMAVHALHAGIHVGGGQVYGL